MLSCCHYYCKQCILSLAKRTGLDKPFSCPECRKDTTLPQGGVDKLQGAFFVNRLKQVHSNLELATGEVEVDCEICFEDKATAFCRQCAKFICAECVKSHKRMKMVFPDHKITTLEGLKEGGAKEIVTPEPTFQTCKMHEENMKLFCFDCGCLICRDCTIKDHRDHNYEFVKKAAPGVKKKLSQHLEPLKEVKKDLLSAVKEVQTTKSKLEAKGQSMIGGVEKWCDELSQIIQNHKKQLVVEIESKILQKTGNLTGQEKGLSISCAGADSVIEFTQQCMEHSTDDEIMCMNAELQSRIDKEIEEHPKSSLKPVEEDDIAVEFGGMAKLKQLCQTEARIIQMHSVEEISSNVDEITTIDSSSCSYSEAKQSYGTASAPHSDGETKRSYGTASARYSKGETKLSYSSASAPHSDGETKLSYSSASAPHSDGETKRSYIYSSVSAPYSDGETKRSYSSASAPHSKGETKRSYIYSSVSAPYSDGETKRSYSTASAPYSKGETKLSYGTASAPTQQR